MLSHEEENAVYDAEADDFIQGLATTDPLIISPDVVILIERPTGAADEVPTTTNILNISSMENVDNLTTGTSTTLRPRNFIPIVQFPIESIKEVVTSQNICAKFRHANFKNTDKSKCKDILFWIYLVAWPRRLGKTAVKILRAVGRDPRARQKVKR